MFQPNTTIYYKNYAHGNIFRFCCVVIRPSKELIFTDWWKIYIVYILHELCALFKKNRKQSTSAMLKQMISELRGFRSGIAMDPVLVVMTLRPWVIGSWRFERMPGPDHPLTQLRVPQERNCHRVSNYFFPRRDCRKFPPLFVLRSIGSFLFSSGRVVSMRLALRITWHPFMNNVIYCQVLPRPWFTLDSGWLCWIWHSSYDQSSAELGSSKGDYSWNALSIFFYVVSMYWIHLMITDASSPNLARNWTSCKCRGQGRWVHDYRPLKLAVKNGRKCSISNRYCWFISRR